MRGEEEKRRRGGGNKEEAARMERGKGEEGGDLKGTVHVIDSRTTRYTVKVYTHNTQPSPSYRGLKSSSESV